MLTVLVVVVWSARMGWRLVPRLDRHSLSVLNPPPHPPRRLLINLLVSDGIGGSGWMAD
ncbi:hypothetical protein [Lentzea flava]|uniref:hypothetical protein n=1 Tax=Lentzea flava TaxID=103732 RepID=UPI001671895C|nr:hypothetical protein [Lentzea flava]